MSDVVLFFLGQSLIIVGAILVSYIRIQVAIGRLQMVTTDLKKSHTRMSGQVGGISRGLARLEGQINGPMHTDTDAR